MKDTLKLFGIIVLAAVIGFSFASCNGEIFDGDPTGGSSSEGEEVEEGEEGEEGGPVDGVGVFFIANMKEKNPNFDSEEGKNDDAPFVVGYIFVAPAEFGSTYFNGKPAANSTIQYITELDFADVSAAITAAIAGVGVGYSSMIGGSTLTIGGLAEEAVAAALTGFVGAGHITTANATAITTKLSEDDYVVAYKLVTLP